MTTLQAMLLVVFTLFVLLLIVILVLLYVKRYKLFAFINQTRRHSATYHEYGFSSRFDYDIFAVIASFEKRYNIRLSYEAKMMIMLPLSELFDNRQFEKRIDFGEWTISVEKLMITIAEEPAYLDKEYSNNKGYNSPIDRSSQSVIKAFASRFCNIPPFCGEK